MTGEGVIKLSILFMSYVERELRHNPAANTATFYSLYESLTSGLSTPIAAYSVSFYSLYELRNKRIVKRVKTYYYAFYSLYELLHIQKPPNLLSTGKLSILFMSYAQQVC